MCVSKSVTSKASLSDKRRISSRRFVLIRGSFLLSVGSARSTNHTNLTQRTLSQLLEYSRSNFLQQLGAGGPSDLDRVQSRIEFHDIRTNYFPSQSLNYT